jgi:hypothetical protein
MQWIWSTVQAGLCRASFGRPRTLPPLPYPLSPLSCNLWSCTFAFNRKIQYNILDTLIKLFQRLRIGCCR